MRNTCTFACYAYFSGINIKNVQIEKKNRLSYAASPTDKGLTMVLLFGPAQFFDAFIAETEKNCFKAIRLIDEKFCQHLLQEGKRETSFFRTKEQEMRLFTKGGRIL